MKAIQIFANQYQKEMGWEISEESYAKSRDSLLNNYMLLTTEVAEVAEELGRPLILLLPMLNMVKTKNRHLS